jgi:hypothetical protein
LIGLLSVINDGHAFKVVPSRCYLYGSPAEDSGKRGHIDIPKVYEEYLKTKDGDKEIKAAGEEKTVERQAMIAEMRRIQNESSSTATTAGREQLQEELDKKTTKLAAFDRMARESLKNKRNAYVQEILKDITAEVKVYGKTNGFSSIVDAKCSAEGEDVTWSIVRELNSGYKQR